MKKKVKVEACVFCEDQIIITPFESDSGFKEWLVEKNKYGDWIFICPDCKKFYMNLNLLESQREELKKSIKIIEGVQEDLIYVLPLILSYDLKPLSIGYDQKPKFITIQKGEQLDEALPLIRKLHMEFSKRSCNDSVILLNDLEMA